MVLASEGFEVQALHSLQRKRRSASQCCRISEEVPKIYESISLCVPTPKPKRRILLHRVHNRLR